MVLMFRGERVRELVWLTMSNDLEKTIAKANLWSGVWDRVG